MTEFCCGTRIVSGRGSLEYLKSMGVQRMMVVADPFFAKNGVAQRVAQMAKEGRIFSDVLPDPTVELAAKGAAQVKEFSPDVLVAIGGGSAMDCAKAMLFFSGQEAILVAVPTTSGSGSEVTDFSILTHNGIKHPLVDRKLAPHVAILDDELLEKLPKSLIADAGFDVLSHAMEALVGLKAGPISDALARDAFCTCFSGLGASFEGNASVRLGIHTAATMAGMAFSQAGLGLCHAMSHSLGGLYHIPHGRLNAILMPAVMQANLPAGMGPYARLARAAGLGGSADTVAVRNLRQAWIRLRQRLEMPGDLAQAGVVPRQLWQDGDKIVTAVLEDPCCQTNPVTVTADLVRQVLSEVAGRE